MAGYHLSADPVQEWTDISLNFEQLAALLSGGSGQQAAVLQLLSAQQLQLAIGSSFVTGNGSSSASVTVTHNLGRVPQFAAATFTQGWAVSPISNLTATTMLVNAFANGPAFSVFVNATTYSFLWIAIG